MTSSSTPKPPPCGSSAPEPGGEGGFSLVEIAMSLGIIAFVVIALLGLMTAGLDAGKLSLQDTAVAAMAKSVFTDVKTNAYASLSNIQINRYFQYDGTPAAGASDNAYYACKIESPAHQIEPPLTMPGVATHSVRIRLTFIWPHGAAKQDEQIFETIIAKY